MPPDITRLLDAVISWRSVQHLETCEPVEWSTLTLAHIFFAVAQFRNFLLGQLLVCDDDVSGESWEIRDNEDPKKIGDKLFSIAADICFKL